MNTIKSEWKIRDYIIAGVVLSAVIALAYLMVGSLATEYNAPGIVDPGFSERYDRFNNQTADINRMWDASSDPEGFNLLTASVEIFKGGIAVASLIFGGVTTITDQVKSIAVDFGIPTPIFNIISILLMVTLSILVIWGIINFMNKTGPI